MADDVDETLRKQLDRLERKKFWDDLEDMRENERRQMRKRIRELGEEPIV